jgi:transcription elongation factor GreB
VEDDEGEEATYRIVGPDETDAEQGWISVESPVAKALLGKEEGDEVTVHRPKGVASYEILEVSSKDPGQ